MTTITTAILILRLLAASQVILSATAIAISPNPYRTRVLGVVLVLGVVSYLISSPVFAHINLEVSPWLALPADFVPPLLFFFTWELFEDDREPPLFVWLIAAIYFFLPYGLGLTGMSGTLARTSTSWFPPS